MKRFRVELLRHQAKSARLWSDPTVSSRDSIQGGKAGGSLACSTSSASPAARCSYREPRRCLSCSGQSTTPRTADHFHFESSMGLRSARLQSSLKVAGSIENEMLCSDPSQNTICAPAECALPKIWSSL